MEPTDRASAVRVLFDRVSGKPPAEREDLLRRAAEAGADASVVGEVRQMLEFLPSTGSPETAGDSASPLRAQREALERFVAGHPREIGPYHLDPEPLGEGGFATVYRAQQTRPVRRTVALKLLKTGVHSKAHADRFRREQQALAVMSHPSVAAVYDAGVSESGWPYLVMEYVPGVPITRYADDRRLTLRERLDLFIPVCEAVQHAHMKGIIHRDLKPSNILVAEVDGRPLPKVIDFGIAKAVESAESDRDEGGDPMTLRGQILGTPAYMSPEQADLGATDIDTRTDVYSLGVVLYELLTGLPPFDPEKLKRSPWAEMLRIVQSEEPPTPSTRVSRAAAEQGQRIAEARRVPREHLSRALRRELEWVPLKAMRKERDNRYQSAEEMVNDIRGYLQNRPLSAGPVSPWYRSRKYLGRHRTGIIAGAAIAGAIAAGIGVAAFFAVGAWEQRRLAQSSAQRADVATARSDTLDSIYKILVLSTGTLHGSRPKGFTVREMLDEFSFSLIDSPESLAEETDVEYLTEQAATAQVVSDAYRSIGELEASERHLSMAEHIAEKFLSTDAAFRLSLYDSRARLLHDRQEYVGAEEVLRRALAEAEGFETEDPVAVSDLLYSLGDVLIHLKRGPEAEESLRRSISVAARSGVADDYPFHAAYMLVNLLVSSGQTEASRTLLEQVVAQARVRGADGVDALTQAATWMLDPRVRGDDPAAAEALAVEAEGAYDVHEVEPDASLARLLVSLANVKAEGGDGEAAASVLERVEGIVGEGPATGSPEHLAILRQLESIRQSIGDGVAADRLRSQRESLTPAWQSAYDKARELWGVGSDHALTVAAYEQAIQMLRADKGADPSVLANALSDLGYMLGGSNRAPEAEKMLAESALLRARALGPHHEDTLNTMHNRANILLALGRHDEAIQLFGEVLDAKLASKDRRDPEVLLTLVRLAAVHLAKGDLNSALPLIDDIAARQAADLDRHQPYLADQLQHLAGVLEKNAETGRAGSLRALAAALK